MKRKHIKEDCHARTAATILEVPVSSITEEQRAAGKAINYGLLYGGRPNLKEVPFLSTDQAGEILKSLKICDYAGLERRIVKRLFPHLGFWRYNYRRLVRYLRRIWRRS